jgi:CBS domain containing-hemolysin-like protein
VQTLGLTVFFLIFCELTPKTVAFERNEAVAPWAARAYAALRPALAPMAMVLERLAGWSTRFVRGGEPEPLSADELETLVEVGARGAQRRGEPPVPRVLRSAEDCQILVPARTSWSWAEAAIAAALDVFADARHARIPLYEGSLDRIVGVLYAKDVIAWTLAPPGDRTVRGIMRPPFFARPATGLEELLRAFQKERVHLAVIVDDAKRALGIVTLEDVLEEIVGDLEDEFEEEEPATVRSADVAFRGRVAVAGQPPARHGPGRPGETGATRGPAAQRASAGATHSSRRCALTVRP